jgi:hypothetical protein
MDDIKRLQTEYGISNEIASQAWAALCDGEWLTEGFGQIDFDPWDGKHEAKRKEIEAAAIEAAKS